MSSYIDGLATMHCLAKPQAHALIVAHLKDVADKGLFRVPRDLAVSLNDHILGACDVRTRSIIFPHTKGASNLDIATAGSVGAGRGLTLSFLHLCLRGDSLVNTVDGNLVRIDQLRVGDSVRTHGGTLAKVKATSSRPAGEVSPDGKMLEIKTWMNFERLTLTPDHEVFSGRGKIPAKELRKGDEIGTPTRVIKNALNHVWTKPFRDSWGRKKRGNDEYRIELNREFGFFCGYYIAEGYTHGGRIAFAHHRQELAFAARAAAAVKHISTSDKTHELEGKRSCTSVYSAVLVRFMLEHFGHTDEKRFPEWVFETSHSFIEGLVLGYLAGDGSKGIATKQNYECPTIYATSVRPRILYQLRHMLASIGWGWGGMTFEKGFVDKRGWNNRASWTLSISGHAALKVRKLLGLATTSDANEPNFKRRTICKYRIADGFVWTKVREIKESHADSVWDIEVDHPDHSFETVVGCVANSEAASYPGQKSFLSILPSVSKAPDTVIALESTAQGRTGIGETFYNYWNGANETGSHWNGYTPIFLSWLDDPTCHRSTHEAEDAPATDLEKELMGKPFNASLSQIAWMRMVLEGECEGSELMFNQEYPHSADVAFVATGDPAFTANEIRYAMGTKEKPIKKGHLERQGKGSVFIENPRGRCLMYEQVKEKCTYYVGVDCARGIEQDTGRATGDFASFMVLNGTTGDMAMQFSDWVNPIEMAKLVDASGRYYNNAMMIVELTGNLGLWCQQVLRDQYQYPNWYMWKGKDDKTWGKAKSPAMGWETTGRTRDLLLSTFRGKLHDGMKNLPGGLKIKDAEFCRQMDLMTMSTGMRWEVQHSHDDVFMAGCLAIIACSQYPPTNILSFKGNTLDKDKSGNPALNKLKPQTDLAHALYRDQLEILKPEKKFCRSVMHPFY